MRSWRCHWSAGRPHIDAPDFNVVNVPAGIGHRSVRHAHSPAHIHRHLTVGHRRNVDRLLQPRCVIKRSAGVIKNGCPGCPVVRNLHTRVIILRRFHTEALAIAEFRLIQRGAIQRRRRQVLNGHIVGIITIQVVTINIGAGEARRWIVAIGPAAARRFAECPLTLRRPVRVTGQGNGSQIRGKPVVDPVGKAVQIEWEMVNTCESPLLGPTRRRVVMHHVAIVEQRIRHCANHTAVGI